MLNGKNSNQGRHLLQKAGPAFPLLIRRLSQESEVFMSGTKTGGLKARDTNRVLHGENFYAVIGAMGGRNGHTGGFAANRALASVAGRKGGLKSKRGPAKKKEA